MTSAKDRNGDNPFEIYSGDKVCLFIDGSNLFATARSLGFDIDYKRLLNHFASTCNLVRAHYYTATQDGEEFSPLKPLVDWLDYNGYSVVTKPIKEFTDSMGRRKIKGNMDLELAVDMLESTAFVDHVVLFSGDGDFRRLVEAVQRKGVKVTVVSTIQSQPSMLADELRRQADRFVDLADITDLVRRSRPDDHGAAPVSHHAHASARPGAVTVERRSLVR